MLFLGFQRYENSKLKQSNKKATTNKHQNSTNKTIKPFSLGKTTFNSRFVEATFPTWTVPASGSTSKTATPPAGGVGNCPENDQGWHVFFRKQHCCWLFFWERLDRRQKLEDFQTYVWTGEEKVVRRRSQPRQATQSSEPQHLLFDSIYSSKIR